MEAARGETARNSVGISFRKSFNNSHPVYNDYIIPYLDDIKDDKRKFLSPMVLDWARYWRETTDYQNYALIGYINKMNTDAKHSFCYDNAIEYVNFSNSNNDWASNLNRSDSRNINDYYDEITHWYNSVK